MTKPWLINTLGGVLHLAAALVVVGAFLLRQSGFGASDVGAFLFWTVPLAALVAAGGPGLVRAGRRVPGGGLGRAALVGLAAGVLALSWVLLVRAALGGWMGAFSFPVLYPWVAGVAAQLGWQLRFLPGQTGPARWGRVVGGALAAGFAAMVLLLLNLSLRDYLSRPAPERYLVPAGFAGRFRVVYAQRGALQPRLEDGRRVLPIPASGVLLIAPEFRGGRIDNDYYMLDEQGHRTRADGDEATSRTAPVQVVCTGSGGFGGPTADGGSSSESPLAINYSEFEVRRRAAPAPTETESYRQAQYLDSLTTTSVERHRLAHPISSP